MANTCYLDNVRFGAKTEMKKTEKPEKEEKETRRKRKDDDDGEEVEEALKSGGSVGVSSEKV